MRHRGGSVADIAILIVSAEDGVKMQTKHAIEVIKKNKMPFIVAINKVDKPNANPTQVKTELLEEGIYVEGYGGDVPVIEISAKAGTGIDDLLQTLLLLAEMQEMTGQKDKLAEGFVIEAHRDPKQGVSATLVIKNGSIKKGQFVVVGDSITPTRMLRDFMGKNIDSASFSSPIQLIGFDSLPSIGSSFSTFETKKSAEAAILEFQDISREVEERADMLRVPEGVALIPVILKTDVSGTGEAISNEIEKLTTEDVIFKIIKSETGNINESDVKLALSDSNTVIIGFHVNEDQNLKNINDYESLSIESFDIIYKLTEWLQELYDNRRIKKEIDTVLGSLKVLKVFSAQKRKVVAGGSILEGTISVGENFKIIRNTEQVGRGKITGLQQGKTETQRVLDRGTECGMMLETQDELIEGDTIETFIRETK